MEIPTSVRVGPYEYKVFFDPAVAIRCCRGECDNDLREIRLSPENSPEQNAVTFLHEIFHAVWEVYALDEFELEMDEHIVQALSNGAAATMQDLGTWPKQIKKGKNVRTRKESQLRGSVGRIEASNRGNRHPEEGR